MKQILLLSILFCTIVMPVLAELTPQELDNIHAIIKEKSSLQTLISAR